MSSLKEYFLLDPDVVFLYHGSFGAAPKAVIEACQNWQLRLERQPVLFLGRELNGLLRESRIALGEYLNADADDLVYIPNATHGVNISARSLQLQPGDEILTSDHEYGACDFTWEFICRKVGTKYVHKPISLPVHSEEKIVEQPRGTAVAPYSRGCTAARGDTNTARAESAVRVRDDPQQA